MKNVIALALCLMLGFGAGCGGDETPAAGGGEGPQPKPAAGDPATDRFATPAPAADDPGCTESNALEVTLSDQEKQPAGAFELTHTTGYIGGMRYNAKSTAKHAYAVFANYEPVIDRYALTLPKEEGQIAILVSFKTDSVEMPLAEQKAAYAKMQVVPGTYAPTWMGKEPGFQVSYFLGGKGGGPAISGKGASGEATLTVSTPKRLCGRIDFTSPNGSTIQGTFNVEIVKDVWAKP